MLSFASVVKEYINPISGKIKTTNITLYEIFHSINIEAVTDINHE
jgi:hypothetical protein